MKTKRRVQLAGLAVAISGTITTGLAFSQAPKVQIPETGVSQIATIEGQYVRVAYNNEGYISLGYKVANNSIGEDWLLLEIGATVLMGADIAQAEPMRSAYLTLSLDREEDADHIYALLADGGEVFMQMERTPFANRFAMLRDRFGTSWMLLHQPDGG